MQAATVATKVAPHTPSSGTAAREMMNPKDRVPRVGRRTNQEYPSAPKRIRTAAVNQWLTAQPPGAASTRKVTHRARRIPT
jgi:hypothetical protein